MMSKRLVLAGWVAAALVAEVARGQTMTFSIDSQGPTNGLPDSFLGTPIDEGSILTPFAPGPLGPNAPTAGPLPPPGLEIGAKPGIFGVVPGGSLGLASSPLGYVELDALSYGRDGDEFLVFSVDEFAGGDVLTEPA